MLLTRQEQTGISRNLRCSFAKKIYQFRRCRRIRDGRGSSSLLVGKSRWPEAAGQSRKALRKDANNVSKGCERGLCAPGQGTLTGSVTRLPILTSGLDMRRFYCLNLVPRSS